MTMKRMKCYLHIGLGRTGSSSLQYYIFNHKEQFYNHNILYYTDSSKNDRFLKYGGNCDHFIRNILHDNTSRFDDIFKIIYDMYLQCKFQKKILLLSSEIFSYYCSNINVENFIEQLSFFFNYELIVYLRDPLDYLYSYWNQNLKFFGYLKPFECILDEQFHGNIRKYIEKSTNTHVISYDKNKTNCIIPFLNILSIPQEDILNNKISASRNNISLDNGGIRLWKILATIPYIVNRRSIHSFLVDYINKDRIENPHQNLIYSRPDPALAERANATMEPILELFDQFISRDEFIKQHPPLAPDEPRLEDAHIRRYDIRLVLAAMAEYAELSFRKFCETLAARVGQEKLLEFLPAEGAKNDGEGEFPPNENEVRNFFENVAAFLQEHDTERKKI